MKNSKILSTLSLSILSLSLVSNDARADRTYADIIRPFLSARSASMGGVRYSTGLYEENFFANPARMIDNPHWRIDILNLTVEANSGTIKNMNKVTKGGDAVENLADTAGENNHVRVQMVLPAYYSKAFWDGNWAAAVGIVANSQGDIGLRRNMSLEPTEFTDVGPVATIARKLLHDRMAVGLTAHYMYRAATRNTFTTVDYIRGTKFNAQNAMGEGSMLDFDIGMRHDIAWEPLGFQLQAAFAIDDVAGGKFTANKPDLITGAQPAPLSQPRTYNAGLSAKKEGFLGFTEGLFALEVQDIGNNSGGSVFRTLHMGGELHVKETIYLRAGLNQGYLAAGVGFDLPLLKIDLGTYGEEMTLNAGGLEDRRYLLRLGIAL